MRNPSLKRSSRKSDRCTGRRAITLIEVVVALVLLASLVAGMVTAYSAHFRQASLAARRQEAIEAADQLLSQWYASSDPQVPRNSQGVLTGPVGFVWQTEIVHQNFVESVPVEVVRLRVYSAATLVRVERSANDPNAGASSSTKPLAQVDVVLPVPANRL